MPPTSETNDVLVVPNTASTEDNTLAPQIQQQQASKDDYLTISDAGWKAYNLPPGSSTLEYRAATKILLDERGFPNTYTGTLLTEDKRPMSPAEIYNHAREIWSGNLGAIVTDDFREWQELAAKGDRAAMLEKAIERRGGWEKYVSRPVGEFMHREQSYEKPLPQHFYDSAPEEIKDISNRIRRNLVTKREFQTVIADRPMRVMSEEEPVTKEEHRQYREYIRTALKEQYENEAIREHQNHLMGKNAAFQYMRIKPALSEKGQKLAEEILANHGLPDEQISRWRVTEFESLPRHEKQMLSALAFSSKATIDRSTASAAVRGFFNMAWELPATAMRHAIVDPAIGLVFGKEVYREIAENRAIMNQIVAPKLRDYNYLEQSIISAVTSAPYTIWIGATGGLGMAMTAAHAAARFEELVALEGGDVTSPEFIVQQALWGSVYAYVEKLPVDRFMKNVSDLQRRQLLLTMFRSWRSALGVGGMILREGASETAEEMLQEGIQDGFVAWGLGKDQAEILAAATQGAMQEAYDTFGAMLITAAGRVGAAAATVRAQPNKFSPQERVEAFTLAAQLIDAHEINAPLAPESREERAKEVAGAWNVVVETQGKKLEGADKVRRDEAKEILETYDIRVGDNDFIDAPEVTMEKALDFIDAYDEEHGDAYHGAQRTIRESRVQLAPFAQAWYKEGTPDKAYAKMVEMFGGNEEAAAVIHEVLMREHRTLTQDSSEEAARIHRAMFGELTPMESLMQEQFPDSRIEEHADGSFTIHREVAGESVEIRFEKTRGFGFDVHTTNEAEATSILHELKRTGNIAEETTVEQWLGLSDAERETVAAAANLIKAGDFRLTIGDDASINNSQADTLTGTITYNVSAMPGTVFHEMLHATVEFMRKAGVITEDDIAKLQEEFGAPQIFGESFNEENAADRYADHVAGKIKFAPDTVGEKIANFIASTARFFRREKIEEARAKTVAEQMWQSIDDGTWTGIPQSLPRSEQAAVAAPAAEAETTPPPAVAEDTTTPPPAAEPAPTPAAGQVSFESLNQKDAAAEEAKVQSFTPQRGRWQASTPNAEMNVGGHYAAVGVDDLITSDSPWFPGGEQGGLQDRSRTDSVVSIQQIKNIKDAFNPVRVLMDSPTTDEGAPMVRYMEVSRRRKDGTTETRMAYVVVSGNARVMAMRELYREGRMGDYALLRDRTMREKGIDQNPDVTSPVYVRVIDGEGMSESQHESLVRFSNITSLGAKTDEENVTTDARVIMSSGIMGRFSVDEHGNLHSRQSAGFVNDFINLTRAPIRDKHGALTREGAARIRRALFAVVLSEGDTALLDRNKRIIASFLTGEHSSNVNRAIRAIINFGPMLLRFSNEMDAIHNILPDIREALMEIHDFSNQAHFTNFSEFLLSQGRLPIEGFVVSPEAQTLAIEMMKRNSATAIEEMLDHYVTLAMSSDVKTPDLFDPNWAPPSKADLLQRSIKATSDAVAEHQQTEDEKDAIQGVQPIIPAAAEEIAPPPVVEQAPAAPEPAPETKKTKRKKEAEVAPPPEPGTEGIANPSHARAIKSMDDWKPSHKQITDKESAARRTGDEIVESFQPDTFESDTPALRSPVLEGLTSSGIKSGMVFRFLGNKGDIMAVNAGILARVISEGNGFIDAFAGSGLVTQVMSDLFGNDIPVSSLLNEYEPIRVAAFEMIKQASNTAVRNEIEQEIRRLITELQTLVLSRAQEIEQENAAYNKIARYVGKKTGQDLIDALEKAVRNRKGADRAMARELLREIRSPRESHVLPGMETLPPRTGRAVAEVQASVIQWMTDLLNSKNEAGEYTYIDTARRDVPISTTGVKVNAKTAALYLFMQNAMEAQYGSKAITVGVNPDNKSQFIWTASSPIANADIAVEDIIARSRKPDKAKIDATIGRSIGMLEHASRQLGKVALSNKDAWALVGKEAKRDSTIFMDPPYFAVWNKPSDSAGEGKVQNYREDITADAFINYIARMIDELAARGMTIDDVNIMITNNWDARVVEAMEAFGFVVNTAERIKSGESISEMVAFSGRFKNYVDSVGRHPLDNPSAAGSVLNINASDYASPDLQNRIDGYNNRRQEAAEIRAAQGRFSYQAAIERNAEAERQYAEVEKRYRGTDKWMKAPNGKPTRLNERQWVQVRTANFKKWFGDWENDPANASKVVDENGEPLVVYHGTTSGDFKEFDTNRLGQRTGNPTAQWGVFASTNPDAASNYADDAGGNVLPLYMSITNPYEISDFLFRERYLNATSNQAALRFKKELQERGYDGIVIRADILKGNTQQYGEHATDRYVAFDPTQIKSATGNRGTFDQANPDIRFSYIGTRARAVTEDTRTAEEIAQQIDPMGLERTLSQRDSESAIDDTDIANARNSFQGTRARNSAASNATAVLAAMHLRNKKPKLSDAERYSKLFGARGISAEEMLSEASAIAASEIGRAAQRALKSKDPTRALSVMSDAAETMAMSAARHGARTGERMGTRAQTAENKALKLAIKSAEGADYYDMVLDTGADLIGTMLNIYPDDFAEKDTTAKPADPEAESTGEDNDVVDLNKAAREVVVEPTPEQLAEMEARCKQLVDAAKNDFAEMEAKRKKRAEERRRKKEAEEDAAVEEFSEADEEFSEADDDDLMVIPQHLLTKFQVDFSNAREFAIFLRLWAAEWIADKTEHAGTAETVFNNAPDRIASYRRTMMTMLSEMARAKVEPTGAASRAIAQMIGDMHLLETATQVERRTAQVLKVIQRNAIRQSQKQLIHQLRRQIKQIAIPSGKFDETERDVKRKVTASTEQAARYIRRVVGMSPAAIMREHKRINDVIQNRLGLYEEHEDIAPSTIASDLDHIEAMVQLGILDRWGGLKSLLPGEIVAASDEIITWLTEESGRLLSRWNETAAQNKALADDYIAAIKGEGEAAARAQQKTTTFDQAVDAAIATTRDRLMDFIKYSKGDIRKRGIDAVNEIEYLLAQGTETYNNLMQDFREDFQKILVEVAGRREAQKYMKRLKEAAPAELTNVISLQNLHGVMTWGQVLQLYSSLRQPEYAHNVRKHGREGHKELIEKYMTPEDMKLINSLMATYAARREALSETMLDIAGIPMLSQSVLYMPARMRYIADEGIRSHGALAWSPLSNMFTRRVKHSRDFDESASIVTMYYERSKESASAIAYAANGIRIRGIIGRRDVKEAMINYYGKARTMAYYRQLEEALIGERTPSEGIQERAMDWFLKVNAYTALSYNPTSMFKQMFAGPAWTPVLAARYSENMLQSWGRLGKAFKITVTSPHEIRRFIDSPGFRSRYGSGITREFKQVLESPGNNWLEKVYRAGMQGIQFGDMVPTVLFGTGVYVMHRQAMLAEVNQSNPDAVARVEARAMTEAWDMVEKAMQSGRTENMPGMYRSGSVWARAILQFASAPLLQYNHMLQAAREWRAGVEGARSKFVNAFLINHLVLPVLMQMAEFIVMAVVGDVPEDDDEIEDFMLKFLGDIIVGPFNRIMIPAMAMQTFYNAAVQRKRPIGGEIIPAESVFSLISTVGVTTHDLVTGDFDRLEDDFLRLLRNTSSPGRLTYKFIKNRENK